jgi:hypothetical protein
MREDVIRVVQTYIDAVRRNDPARLPLDPDIVFEGPLGKYDGIEAFLQGLAEFVPVLNGIKVMHLTADEDTCAAVLEIDTIFGVIPFLEYFTLRAGKIISIRAYYDPRPVLEGLEKRATA